jgi:hypothetical protein
VYKADQSDSEITHVQNIHINIQGYNLTK